MKIQEIAAATAKALAPVFDDAVPGGVQHFETADLRDLLLALKPMVDSYIPGCLLMAEPFQETRERLRSLALRD